jgi:hypothetical protein
MPLSCFHRGVLTPTEREAVERLRARRLAAGRRPPARDDTYVSYYNTPARVAELERRKNGRHSGRILQRRKPVQAVAPSYLETSTFDDFDDGCRADTQYAGYGDWERDNSPSSDAGDSDPANTVCTQRKSVWARLFGGTTTRLEHSEK